MEQVGRPKMISQTREEDKMSIHRTHQSAFWKEAAGAMQIPPAWICLELLWQEFPWHADAVVIIAGGCSGNVIEWKVRHHFDQPAISTSQSLIAGGCSRNTIDGRFGTVPISLYELPSASH